MPLLPNRRDVLFHSGPLGDTFNFNNTIPRNVQKITTGDGVVDSRTDGCEITAGANGSATLRTFQYPGGAQGSQNASRITNVVFNPRGTPWTDTGKIGELYTVSSTNTAGSYLNLKTESFSVDGVEKPIGVSLVSELYLLEIETSNDTTHFSLSNLDAAGVYTASFDNASTRWGGIASSDSGGGGERATIAFAKQTIGDDQI